MTQEIISTSSALRPNEDPFYLAPEEDLARAKPFSPFFLLFWSFALIGGYFLIDTFAGGFADMRKYGWDDEGRNWILTLTREERMFMSALLLLLPAAFMLTLATARRAGPAILSLGRRLVADDKHARRFAIAAAGIATAASIAVAFFVLDRTPITDDENVYVFQARILASGRLTLPSLPPEDRLFGDNIFLVNEGTVYGQYPFGHSIFLLPGIFAGLPHLMNLLAAFLTVIGVFVLARDLYDRATALVATVLLVTSPMFLMTSATLLAHSSTLLFLTWFGVFALRTARGGGWRDTALTAICFGAMFHIRSTTAILLAGPAALILAASMFARVERNGRPRIRLAARRNAKRIVVLAAILAVFAAGYLLLNDRVNGSPLRTNYHAVWEGNTPHDGPFGFERGAWNIYHTPRAGLRNLINNFARLNVWLFGWPISLLALFVWLVRPGKKAFEWLLFLPLPMTFAVYVFFFWPGVAETGPVLYYELLAPLVILSARGIFAARDWIAKSYAGIAPAEHTATFVAFAVLLAFATTTQTELRALVKTVEPINEPYELIRDRGIEAGIVFTDFYIKSDAQDSWVAGHRNTSPLLGDDLNFFLNLGAKRNRAFREKHFPNEPAWVMWWTPDGPRLVPLDDYDEDGITRNFPEMR
ncbi:glycosyltransferase family 39 protein [bacterium]|nr:glycosyltransferase family 39 protein [bacterium]